ncbi:hypothetical protein [Roseicyclus marinus]|uniref:hypothetical protein n=1 Tax=Roseicyclus marinus TaxID=2161673 RepID=UPI00241032BF|nr:hypothetical protein [Roseicyclus marinus]MDG3040374.1 hypothetical protein [Roseicyclus marinus]
MNHALRLLVCALPLLPADLARAEGLELSGSIAMGLAGGSNTAGADDLRPVADLDLRVRLSHTTDAGLTLAFEYEFHDIETESQRTTPGIPRRR